MSLVFTGQEQVQGRASRTMSVGRKKVGACTQTTDHKRYAPVVRLRVLGIELDGRACREPSVQGPRARVRERTGVAESVPMLLELDARVCAVAPERRVRGVLLDGERVQVRRLVEFVGCPAQRQG